MEVAVNKRIRERSSMCSARAKLRASYDVLNLFSKRPGSDLLNPAATESGFVIPAKASFQSIFILFLKRRSILI
jgi:hypothetical protein